MVTNPDSEKTERHRWLTWNLGGAGNWGKHLFLRGEVTATKILLVDDNKKIRCLLEKRLQDDGQEVLGVGNGAEALEQILTHPPDIIISDILMPKMDGYMLCYECKRSEQLKNIPFIFYTGVYTSAEDEKFALSLGADVFIRKPTSPGVFMQIIREAFEKVRSGLSAPSEVTSIEPSLFFTQHNKRIVSKLEEETAQLQLEITRRKRMEEMLRAVNEKLTISAQTLRSVKECVSITNKEHTLIFVNSAFLEAYGFSENEILGKTVDLISSPNNSENLREKIRTATMKGGWKGELLNLKKDGTEFPIELSTSTLKNDNGKISGYIGIATDITERKRAAQVQAALYRISETAHSAQNLEGVYRSIHTLIADLMPAKNNFFIALYDEATDEISFPYFIYQYDKIPASRKSGRGLTEYVLRTGKALLASGKKLKELAKKEEIEVIGKPPVYWLGAPLKTHEKIIGVVSVQTYLKDVVYREEDKNILSFVSEQVATAIEHRRADEKLKKAHDELEIRVKERTAELKATNETLQAEIVEHKRAEEMAKSASRAKSEFLASMSHELRTPLNAINGFSELLQKQYFGELNKKQAEYVTDILESGKHLLSLINDILDLSKVEAGKMKLELSRVNLKELLENGLIMIKQKALKHGIKLDLHIAQELDELEITADARKLKQIMFNLLSNAAKFTADGGTIEVAARQEGEELFISVSDTGIGIAPEEQEKIFGEFYQIKSGLADKTQGTGLGLALTKTLVKMHGGRVWVESKGEGRGSRFSFSIPLRNEKKGGSGK